MYFSARNLKYVIPVLLGIFWITASRTLQLNHHFLPELMGVASIVANPETLQQILHHTLITVMRVLWGVGLAFIIGVPLGLLLAAYKNLKVICEPFLDFIRGIPIAMLFPLTIVFFGLGETSRTALVLFLAIPILSTSVMIAAEPNSDNEERKHYFYIHKARLSFTNRTLLIIWDALPGIISGSRISLSLGLVVIIVTEMFFVSDGGIGWMTFRAYEVFNIDLMYTLIAVAGLVSLGFNNIFKHVERSFVR